MAAYKDHAISISCDDKETAEGRLAWRGAFQVHVRLLCDFLTIKIQNLES